MPAISKMFIQDPSDWQLTFINPLKLLVPASKDNDLHMCFWCFIQSYFSLDRE